MEIQSCETGHQKCGRSFFWNVSAINSASHSSSLSKLFLTRFQIAAICPAFGLANSFEENVLRRY